MRDRISHPGLSELVMSAEQAAAMIKPGMTVAMSGFTGAGYPKAVPQALASQIEEAHTRGEDFQIKVLTGASTAPELDGTLAEVTGERDQRLVGSDLVVLDALGGGDEAGVPDARVAILL